jgi:hypothetical protein
MSTRLETGSHRFTEVRVIDEPGAGNACHEYAIDRANDDPNKPCGEFGYIRFQNGPVKENGVNGCFQEDLLIIVIDRLKSFQAGSFACRENAIALTKCEEALLWLNKRTQDRQSRGVEGTSTK